MWGRVRGESLSGSQKYRKRESSESEVRIINLMRLFISIALFTLSPGKMVESNDDQLMFSHKLAARQKGAHKLENPNYLMMQLRHQHLTMSNQKKTHTAD